ncbi:TPA: hypothetical protein HA265_04465, partial [Candidatus Woesearchaeota archaeon]|nr:hypothetical protein [Candidatus Woesearchaeota archaeon]
MTALQDTMRLSSQLNSLKDKNINDPKVLKPYILTLLELEKAIEAYEYEQVVRLNKENERVSGLLKDIMLGTDPKEVSQLLAKIAQMLKNSAEQVSKGTAADDFTKAKDYLHKSMSRGDLSKSVLKEIDEIQKRAAMMRKEEMAFETVKPLKSRLLLAFFQELVEEIEWDFERVYQMKVQLHDHYEYLRTADDFFTLHENRDFGPAFDQLTIHMKKIDEELKNKILFLAQAIANTAHAIDHLSRHTT